MTPALPILNNSYVTGLWRKVSKAAPIWNRLPSGSLLFHAEVFFPRLSRARRNRPRREELPDKHAAWEEATVTAGQILQGLDGKLQPDREWRMEVMDEFQNPLYVLHINAEKPK
jgi:hypothetical protein